MKNILYILVLLATVSVADASAQIDRREVRKGNRQFKKENYREADIEYRKALVKDSLSMAANYNLANNLFRQNDLDQATKVMDRIKDVAPASDYAADYYYNVGDVAIGKKDWQAAVDALKQSLLRNPGDLEAKENYIYAKKMLENQQNQQNQNNDNDQQNDQNQNQQQQQGQQPKITPQAAQQMLQAIQAKEKETQEKVNKEKAKDLNSRQKENNW